MEFRVCIAGGREFNDYARLCVEVDRMLATKKKTHTIIIICGGARGADALGKRYAEDRGFDVEMYEADWELHGKSAGYKRNRRMALVSDAVVAYWDCNSKGTKHMIDLADKAGCILRVKYYT